MFKKHIQKTLEKYVRKYVAKHQPKIVLITGSVGKTTTKLAIATVLSQKYRVRVHAGNHNTHLSIPLAILGINYPDNIRSISEWMRVRKAAKQRIKSKTSDCDVIVQELGTDHKGDIAQFGNYLYADIAVITAVSPEHMEFFGSLNEVAEEELAVSNFAKVTAINRDDVSFEYSSYINTPSFTTYGLGGAAEYRFQIEDESLFGYKGSVILSGGGEIPMNLQISSESALKSVVAATFVASQLGMTAPEIAKAAANIVQPAGRMNILKGLKDSILIDDTYNSSPLAAEAALKTLYKTEASQRIAILGDMNELGQTSAREHEKIGQLCNPERLSWLVTVGPESKKYTAGAALMRGVPTKSFDDPISAGAFVHSILEKDAIVLAKGSQNQIFVEEALKLLLHDIGDDQKLVRQSTQWLELKNKQFAKF